MIKSAKLSNYQPHQSSEIVFSPNVTTIIGDSDSGKSAFLRGLLSVIERGPFYIRHHQTIGKAEIVFDDNVISRNAEFAGHSKCPNCKTPIPVDTAIIKCSCGEIISPKVVKDFYLLNGEQRDKFGTKLLDEIANAMRMNPVTFVDVQENLNITKQFDDHFFVGKTYAGSKRNKIISSLIVDADKVDLLIQKLSSEIREGNSRFHIIQSEIILKKDKIERTHSDIEELKRLKSEVDSNNIQTILNKINRLTELNSGLSEVNKVMKYAPYIEKSGKSLKVVKDRIPVIKAKESTIGKFTSQVSALSSLKSVEFTRIQWPDFSESLNLNKKLSRLSSLNESIKDHPMVEFKRAEVSIEDVSPKLKAKLYRLESIRDNLEGFRENSDLNMSSLDSLKREIILQVEKRDKLIDSMDICPLTKKKMSQDCKDILKGK